MAWDGKKTLFPEKQNHPDVIRQRKDWGEIVWKKALLDKLIFLDETGINLAMTRLYSRAYSDERVNDYVPDARFERERT